MTFYRRNLPHWHPEGKTIFITWRLYNSLPASLLKEKSAARNDCATRTILTKNSDSPGKKFLRLDSLLDSAQSGPLWLADSKIAAIVETPILQGAIMGRYELHAY